jgi:hypothetical protein
VTRVNIFLGKIIIKRLFNIRTIYPYIDFERIRTRYPGIENQIEEKIRIDSKNWRKMKKRYYLTCIVIEDILDEAEENDDEMKKSVIETFHNMFTDDETKLSKLLEKYTQKTQQSKSNWNILNVFKTSNITKAKRRTNEKSDKEFIQELVKFELFEGYEDIKKKIINTFIKEYHKWKKDDFPNNLQEILKNIRDNKRLEDKLKREYEEEKKEIEKKMFEKICNEIETKYKDG